MLVIGHKMIVFEAKLRGTGEQYKALNEALRTARFVRNSCLRYWMDNKGVNKYDLNLSTGQKLNDLQKLIAKVFQVEQNSTQMIQTMTKETLAFAPMLFDGNWLLLC